MRHLYRSFKSIAVKSFLKPVESGKMRPDELERLIVESIERKELPFMVCLTSGTTVLGAFDPIEPVSVICKKYNMWLHVDVRLDLSCSSLVI